VTMRMSCHQQKLQHSYTRFRRRLVAYSFRVLAVNETVRSVHILWLRVDRTRAFCSGLLLSDTAVRGRVRVSSPACATLTFAELAPRPPGPGVFESVLTVSYCVMHCCSMPHCSTGASSQRSATQSSTKITQRSTTSMTLVTPSKPPFQMRTAHKQWHTGSLSAYYGLCRGRHTTSPNASTSCALEDLFDDTVLSRHALRPMVVSWVSWAAKWTCRFGDEWDRL
jgi:hypothetical protein